MLESQLQKQFGLSEIKPEIEMLGISIGTDIKFRDSTNLVRRTTSLIDKMKQRKYIRELTKCEELDTSGLYNDDSIWFNGIFSFNVENAEKEKIFSYLLWRPWRNSIILLVGSPNNIIGEREIKGSGVFSSFEISTPMLLEVYLNMVAESFQSDEENFVRLSDSSFSDNPLVPVSSIPSINSDISISKHKVVNIPSKLIYLPDALKAGVFCVKYLSHLPQSRIDTTFKIFRKMDLNRRTNLSEWIRALRDSSGNSISPELWKYKRIYIGSPLCTALA